MNFFAVFGNLAMLASMSVGIDAGIFASSLNGTELLEYTYINNNDQKEVIINGAPVSQSELRHILREITRESTRHNFGGGFRDHSEPRDFERRVFRINGKPLSEWEIRRILIGFYENISPSMDQTID